MSLLINGKLQKNWLASEIRDGEFIRQDSQFRHWVTSDGQAGASGDAGFKAEANRYHLYVSYACPWAHRTLIFRKIKKLEAVISYSVVHPEMDEQGWKFADYPGSTPDHVNGFSRLHQVYTLSEPHYSGIVTVPILFDKHKQVIVNNESSEIIRMFNSAFNAYSDVDIDYYPGELQGEIDRINQFIYDNINNGVYRCGFAANQQAYDSAFDNLFRALDEIENRLAKQRYLVGSKITEADWRLLPTLLRFDPVYVCHFKCNLRRIADYPNLFNYMLDLYQQPGVAQTLSLDHVKRHYFVSHETINPSRIIAKGPLLNYQLGHDRNRFETE